MKLKIIESDAGLWEVFRLSGGAMRQVGVIWDSGSKVACERATEYQVLDGWHGCDPGHLIDTASTWIGALNKLRKIVSK